MTTQRSHTSGRDPDPITVSSLPNRPLSVEEAQTTMDGTDGRFIPQFCLPVEGQAGSDLIVITAAYLDQNNNRVSTLGFQRRTDSWVRVTTQEFDEEPEEIEDMGQDDVVEWFTEEYSYEEGQSIVIFDDVAEEHVRS